MRAAMLYTDIPDYYAPLGFTHCYHLRALSFPAKAEALPNHWHMLPADDSPVSACNRIYRQMISGFNGSILRNPQNWSNFLGELYTDQGRVMASPQAYLLWQPEQDTLKLREVGYLNKPALFDALEVARRLAAEQGFAKVRWDAPMSAPLHQADERRVPYVMARSLACPADADAADVAAATLNMFTAPDAKLWVNEMT
jgi:predicted acetyltransferase